MTQVTIDLFFVTGEGFEGHIALIPGEGESGFQLLQSASKALKQAGCAARPAKSYGGGGNKPKEPLPTICPTCQGEIIQKEWTSPENKIFIIHRCKSDEKHYKKFVLKVVQN